MKLTITFLAFLLTHYFAHGQTAAAVTERVIKLAPRSIPKYVVKERKNVYFLQTGFNDAVYTDPGLLKELAGKVIVKAELVYTTYHKSENFDQHALNRKRLKALFSAAPNSLRQPGIEWVLIAQTGCTSAEMGKEFFHGVVITVREDAPDLADVEASFLLDVAKGTVPVAAYETYLKDHLAEPVGDTTAVTSKPVKSTMPEFRGGERARIDYFTRNLKFPTAVSKGPSQMVAVQFMIDKNGDIGNIVLPGVVNANPYHQEVKKFVETMPKWKPGTVDGKPTDCMVRFMVQFMDRGTVAAGPLEVFSADTPALPEKASDYSKIPASPQTRTVTATLEKNNWPNSVIVADVTGSMAAYNAQVMIWLKEKFDKKDKSVLRIVLFNDGDNKSDTKKKPGDTGGIYSFVPKDFEEVVETLTKAMKKGSGGDLPENNIEALIQAQNDSPTAENLVLMADNPATPRDMQLLGQLTKPVHVIVCGYSPVLNPAWLDIARKTKGSLQFGGKAYTKLDELFEEGEVKVGTAVFVLRNGKFEIK